MTNNVSKSLVVVLVVQKMEPSTYEINVQGTKDLEVTEAQHVGGRQLIN